MTREVLLKNTVAAISAMPDNKLSEIADFVEFLKSRGEEEILQKGIEQLATDGGPLHFLHEEEELYSPSDLKKKFH